MEGVHVVVLTLRMSDSITSVFSRPIGSPTTVRSNRVRKRAALYQDRMQDKANGRSMIESSLGYDPSNMASIAKVIISLDPGSTHLKAAFKVFETREKINPKVGVDRNILPGMRTVIWPNQQEFIETQIRYEWWAEPNGELKYHQLWGREVTVALNERRISPEQVFRWLKPAIYADETRRGDRERIESQIKKLPQAIQFSNINKIATESTRLTFLDLFSDFLGYAWRYTLSRIKERYPALPWPEPSDTEAYRDFDPCSQTTVEVVIPLPAGSKPQHVGLAIEAALRAGIPSPYIVAEPAAAYAFDVQSRTDAHGPIHNTMCTIAADIGGGSTDFQAYSTAQTSPLVVREEVEGTDDWCGGNRVNETCRLIVEKKCSMAMPQILDALRTYGRPLTEHQFLDEVELQFEMRKRSWVPGECLSLEISGLPDSPLFGLRRNCLELSDEDVTEAFNSSINPIMRMLDAMFERFHTRYPLSTDGIGAKIAEILLVGGSSASPYLKQKIRDRYTRGTTTTRPYSVTVRMADRNGMGAETCIAQGSLLLMMDRHFVTERVIRRGYCVQLDEESQPNDRKNRLVRVHRDPHDGTKRRVEVTKFLIKIGERIGDYHQAHGPSGCWRGLFLDEKTEAGWVLEEPIFYSDQFSLDGVWINHPRNNHIQRCGVLRVQLTEEDCSSFETKISKIGGRPYKYLEYQVQFEIKGIVMSYQIVIPKNGQFLEAGDFGRDPIRKVAKLDCSGVFGLFNVGGSRGL
jgi:hypothetical protein